MSALWVLCRYRHKLHWRLHRSLFGKDPAQTSLLERSAPVERSAPASVICRSSHEKARIELQANLYASCVLMPRKLVFAAWDEMFPDRKRRVLQPVTPIDHSFVEIARPSYVPGVELEQALERLEDFSKPLAEKFLVSPIAMRIRLEKLGLLHRAVPVQRLLADGS
jgi:Zn-dependent peptidase ImmA (M78 family)